MGENFFEKAGTFAQDAVVDTAADGAINNVIDSVAGHIPGGAAVEGMLKTGVDLAANNFINSELGNVEGAFGSHAAAPAPESQPTAEADQN